MFSSKNRSTLQLDVSQNEIQDEDDSETYNEDNDEVDEDDDDENANKKFDPKNRAKLTKSR